MSVNKIDETKIEIHHISFLCSLVNMTCCVAFVCYLIKAVNISSIENIDREEQININHIFNFMVKFEQFLVGMVSSMYTTNAMT